MNKINKNTILNFLAVSIVIVFGLFLAPSFADAQALNSSTGGNYVFGSGGTTSPYTYSTPYTSYYNQYPSYSSNPVVYTPPPTYVAPMVTTPSPDYSNAPTINSGASVAENSTPKKSTSVAKTTTPKTTLPADPNGYVLVPKSQLLALNSSQLASLSGVVDPNNTGNSLVGNAIFGGFGFMPSGLLQWILLAILILFITILARLVFGGAKKYKTSPMKHS